MALTYTDSKAICVQDPSAVGGPISGDPFQSSFGEPQAPSSAPTAAAVRSAPSGSGLALFGLTLLSG